MQADWAPITWSSPKSHSLCLFSVAARPNYYKLSGLKATEIHPLTGQEVKSHGLRGQQGMLPLDALRKTHSLSVPVSGGCQCPSTDGLIIPISAGVGGHFAFSFV